MLTWNIEALCQGVAGIGSNSATEKGESSKDNKPDKNIDSSHRRSIFPYQTTIFYGCQLLPCEGRGQEAGGRR